MKKVLSFVICLALALSLLSCSTKKEEAEEKTEQTKAEVAKKYTPPNFSDMVAKSTVDPVLKQKREQAEMARKMREQMGLPQQY
jgi:PBP1b-binding outer membrane lipoprotein LpoB